MGKRRALLVGVSYVGTPSELRGCHNDVNMMKKVLIKHYSFVESEIVVMTDTPGRQQPTGENIRSALGKMAKEAEAGDILVFHFSGHGGTVPCDTEDDGFDECICPSDFNCLLDDDISDVMSSAPAGINFTMIADCCHSGGLFDKTKVQMLTEVINDLPNAVMLENLCLQSERDGDDETEQQENDVSAEESQDGGIQDKPKKAKALTTAEICERLSKKSGTEVSKKNMRSAFTSIFGNQATHKLTFTTSMRRMLMGQSSFKINQGVLVSACREHELASECSPKNGLPHGALTKAIYEAHELMPEDFKYTNQSLIANAAYLLVKDGQEQRPCLYCSDEALEKPFIDGSWY